MSDDAKRPEAADNASQKLDLSGLNELSLGPQWGSGDMPAGRTPNTNTRNRDKRPDRRRDDSSGGSAGSSPRDRRSARIRRPDAESGGRRDGGERGPSRFAAREEFFQPVLAADFYPDDVPFKALSQAIRNSYRTYELFEIARLILEKPERWVCVAKHPEQKEGEPALLQASVPDGLPFENEVSALNHVFGHYIDQFYDIETFEGEAPSGSFLVVHRCGMTGELLAPPNYHRYQAICREHHATRLSNVSFERFQGKIESVKDEEVLAAWTEKMKTRQRYTLKAEYSQGAETPLVFEQIEDARLHLISNFKDKLVRPAYSVRFLGKDLPLLPANDIFRRSIESLLEQQKRFPLSTANNLRGRLRRMNFAVYKKGSKGVSFVCAIKRRFRQPGEVLAENLADLIAFIEAHPETKAQNLTKDYLGIEADSSKPEEKPATVEGAAETTPTLSQDQEQVLALRRDLRYLVSQGYVIEYSDGRLFVPPPIQEVEQKPKTEEKEPQAQDELKKEPSEEEEEKVSQTDDAPAAEEGSTVSEAEVTSPVDEPKPETVSEVSVPPPEIAFESSEPATTPETEVLAETTESPAIGEASSESEATESGEEPMASSEPQDVMTPTEESSPDDEESLATQEDASEEDAANEESSSETGSLKQS